MKKIQIMAIAAAVITIIAAYFFMINIKKANEIPSGPVILSAVDIPANTQITAEMVTVAKQPISAINQSAVTEAGMVIGKISSNDIYKGEQIVSQEIIEPGAATGELSYAIAQGKRAVTIKVDPVSSVSGLIEPGNMVDVIGANIESATSRTVLENILVLSVGKRMTSGSSTSAEDVYETVTLSLSPEQALTLREAQTKLEITLALRSAMDK